MVYKVSRNRKQISRNDKLIRRAEGIYDNHDEVKVRLRNLIVVDLPDGSLLLNDANTKNAEIEKDITGRHAVGIVELLK
jgi:hypothetical protein